MAIYTKLSCHSPHYARGMCRACYRRHRYATDAQYKEKQKQNAKAWKLANPEKAKEQDLRQYGLTVAERDEILKSQGGVCAACHETGRMVVDHCHKTGKVRGILCDSCNLVLGHAKDNPAKLAALVEYLR
jgi:hypothetical protein